MVKVELANFDDVCQKREAGLVKIERNNAGLKVFGDDAGAFFVYLYKTDRTIMISSLMQEILAGVKQTKRSCGINYDGLSHFLQNNFVVLPQTIFKDIYILGVGDRVEIKKCRGVFQFRFFTEFPYFMSLSKRDSEANTNICISLLGEAVARNMPSVSKPYVMFSAGKDSAMLGLAMAKAGIKPVECLTYATDNKSKDESQFASVLAKKFGFNHRIVHYSNNAALLEKILMNYFMHAPMPCADESLIPYLLCLNEVPVVKDAVVIDGSGNDVYCGHVPSAREHKKYRYSIGGYSISAYLRQYIKPDSMVNHFLDTKAENCLPGRKNFKYPIVKYLHPAIIDASVLLRSISRESKNLSYFDFRAYVRGRLYDQGEIMLKARMACAAQNLTVCFPYCDNTFIHYYFNLPESNRFDKVNYVNKTIFRQILRDEIGYDDSKIGKRAFVFEDMKFFTLMDRFIWEQIYACVLWNKKGLDGIYKYHKDIANRPHVRKAILTLFLLSGWLNNTEYGEQL